MTHIRIRIDRDHLHKTKTMVERDTPQVEHPKQRNAPKSQAMERIERRAQEAIATLTRRNEDKPLLQKTFLPGVDIGAMPNHLNRSSLIAPIARGRRVLHQQTVMVSRSDCVIEYTGEQLDEADGDLIMALIFFGRPYPLGTPVPLNRKELLRKIKWGKIGSTQYEWLHRSMKRLRGATLFLEAKKKDGSTRYTVGKMTSFNMLKELEYDDENETYTYMLDPRWVLMFGNREYARLDWEKRMQIGRNLDMAKTLQRLISTSSDTVQRYALDELKKQMEYTGRLRDFQDALRRAVSEMERVKIITKGEIGDSTRGKLQLTLKTKSSG